MKKLVLAASLFVAVAITAQQRRVEVKKDKVEYRQNQNQNQNGFYGLGLSSSQERQIKSLERERLTERGYEARIKSILTKQQYQRYVQNQRKDGKDRKVAFNRSFR